MGRAIATTDVCLILEGTYPFVRGGVSSWVHQLVEGMPELTFSLLAVSATRQAPSQRRYALPPNVKVFAEVFVHELAAEGRAQRRASAPAWQAFRELHRAADAKTRAAHLRDLLATSAGLDRRHALSADEALFSRAAFELAVERYRAAAPDSSFLDWFWTWRAVHAPLFQTMASEIPPARLYHAVSTGYAGLVAAIAKQRTHKPLLLTEHGLYVRERLIDIARAEWAEEPGRAGLPSPTPGPLKTLWSDFFVTLAQLTYDAADQVVALFEANQELQHQLGADPARTRVIPNGVAVDDFLPLAGQRRRDRPRRVGFVGRVVPIKDVKTLLRAFQLVAAERPDVELWIVGPTDEDAAYFAECRELVSLLGLHNVRFTGSQDVRRIYPEIDVLVLTSLSEGQPLTILEAACAGVPSVVTDVGDCRALVEGRGAADRALGPSGLVTRMGDAGDSARAILSLIGSDELAARMSAAAVARVTRFYRQRLVIDRYRALYTALGTGLSPPNLDPDSEDVPRLRLVRGAREVA